MSVDTRVSVSVLGPVVQATPGVNPTQHYYEEEGGGDRGGQGLTQECKEICWPQRREVYL